MTTDTQRTEKELKDIAAESAAVGIAHAFGGIVIALICTFVSLLTTGLAIGIAQNATGKLACEEGLGTPVSVVLVIFGIAVSLFVGRTLYRSKRFVGQHSDGPDADPADKAYAKMLRKRFSWASMIVYCTLAPPSWIYMLAAVNCSGN